jgi:hypothetical protein
MPKPTPGSEANGGDAAVTALSAGDGVRALPRHVNRPATNAPRASTRRRARAHPRSPVPPLPPVLTPPPPPTPP